MAIVFAAQEASAADSGLDHRDPLHRISQLLDPDSLQVISQRPGVGVVIARGQINSSNVIVFCTDATTSGGAIGRQECWLITAAIEAALEERCPVIGIWHSGGAKLAEGVMAMDGISRMFSAMVQASGQVLQLSVVLGPAAGGAAYGSALTDLVIMSDSGRVFITGPDIVRSVTGERIDMDGLGGPEVHGRRSGVAHLVTDSNEAAFAQARKVVTLFAQPGHVDCRLVRDKINLRTFLPSSPRRAYDVRPLVRAIVDDRDGDGSFLELQEKWAPNIVVGLGRIGGRTVGVIANNPLRKGGCLDSLSAEKAARFVRMCDAFGIPLLVLVDVPGYLPGITQEWDGVVRRGAKLLHAFAEAVVPRVTLVTRKSYGGAYIAMNSRGLGATAVLAWPEAEIAVMGATAAVEILYRRQLAQADPADRDALRAELAAEHELMAGSVGKALNIGVVDEIIDPAETRCRIGHLLAAAPERRGQHRNIPL
jgi:acetyl-CoA/propionyl-CoA carboxylase carboxyl transferase subunit